MLIGLAGKMGTGKSAIAARIVERGFTLRSYADALRDEVALAMDVPRSWTKTQKAQVFCCLEPPLPRSTMTMREILQWWGTDYRRAQDGDYWTRRMAHWLDEHPDLSVVIDDVRFPNEADLVTRLGGTLVLVHPWPGYEQHDHSGHVSETALEGYSGFTFEVHPAYGVAALDETARFIWSFTLERYGRDFCVPAA